MFGQNEIVGKKFFKGTPPQTILMTSMFFTLQGEGPFRGEPAYFTRFTKCNLACSFCDTFFDKGDSLTFSQICTRIDNDLKAFFAKQGCKVPEWAKFYQGVILDDGEEVPEGRELVPGTRLIEPKKRKMALVITGGEPMLQANITDYCKEMLLQFDKVQIESNGILVQGLPDAVTLVCSPKCAEKDGVPTSYLKPNPAMLERANCLKFVMNATHGSPYSRVPAWAHEWAENTGRQVFISPMNVYNEMPHAAKMLRAKKQGNEITLEERSTVDEVVSFWEDGLLDMKANRLNHEYAAKYAITHGFVFNVQAHLLASVA